MQVLCICLHIMPSVPFIVSLSIPTSSHRIPALAETLRDTCCVQIHEKQGTVHEVTDKYNPAIRQ
jgi:hypothetical protein